MGVISPLVIGICVAFILNILLRFIEEKFLKGLSPKVEWIQRDKRVLSVILTYAFTITVIILMILFIVPQVVKSMTSLVETLPGYGKVIQKYGNKLYMNLGISQDIWDQILANLNNLTSSLTKFTANTVNALINMTIGFTAGVLELFIGVIFSIYILLSKEKLIAIVAKMNKAYMNEKTAKRLTYIMSEINDTFSKFIGGQMIESLILGLLCFVGMVILRIPYAPLVSVLVAITGLIPVIGAYLGIIPSAFIIFMESPIKALIFIIFITILQQIEGNVIYPKVVGKAIGLDGFWVLLAIVMAGKMFGIVGMLIGVPTMAVVYSLVRRDANKRLSQAK
ncbi:MAG TPA: AI-2E family transporter [Epulopiscium sp.]|nr:AI-2E family transporter [Candidatus Epulonipiscium sp.]